MQDYAQVLELVKMRLNRLATDTSLDSYLNVIIPASDEELKRQGITIDLKHGSDLMLLCDLVCWNYSNRDKADGMPKWLRLRIRERWLQEKHDS